jgi:Proton-conducting membrane transporter
MNLGVFAVINSLRQRDVIGDDIDDIAGLYFRAPTEAVLMQIFLLSLAGIPPLAGFYGKCFIFLSLMESGHYVLASLAVLYVVFACTTTCELPTPCSCARPGRVSPPRQRRHEGGLARQRLRHRFHRNIPRPLHSHCDLESRDRLRLDDPQGDLALPRCSLIPR